MKTALFVLVAALAACGGRTSLDQRSAADAVSADARADNYNASYSYDGQFEDDSGDVARAVRSHALATGLASVGEKLRWRSSCYMKQGHRNQWLPIPTYELLDSRVTHAIP